MRPPRMTTRRWMFVVIVSGVLAWAGLLMWRSHHYRRLASLYRERAAGARELEEFCLSDLRGDEMYADECERQLQEVLLNPGSGPLYDLWKDIAEEGAKNARAWVERSRKDAEEATALRRQRERLAREYQGAVSRPWRIVKDQE